MSKHSRRNRDRAEAKAVERFARWMANQSNGSTPNRKMSTDGTQANYGRSQQPRAK